MSGLYTWKKQDVAGAEIGPVKGKAGSMANAVQERLIRILGQPAGRTQGRSAGTTETFWWGANPGALLQDGVDKVGTTSVAWQAVSRS